MIRHLLPWAALTIVGILLVATQVGDGTVTSSIQIRLPWFLLGTVLTVGGLLKLAAVATDPERRGREDEADRQRK